jgi:hypothetical protein
MTTFNSVKRSATKNILVLFLISLPVLFAACGGPMHMISMETKPPFAIKPDKAVLVIARTSSVGFLLTVENYIDGKMIGQTKGKSYFVAEVAPGQHYVIAHGENWAAAKMQFDAGRIYFLNQSIVFGFPGFSPMTAEEALVQTREEGCEYRVYNTQMPGEDLSAKELKEAKERYDQETKEDPGRHKDTLEYRGYDKL